MLPLLKLAGDKNEHSVQEAIDQISKQFNLSDAERNEVLPSGQQRVIDNRTGWARTYMAKAGLLEVPRRSYFKITNEGLRVLAQNPERINNKFLERYPTFLEFHATKREESEKPKTEQERTPQEQLEAAHEEMNSVLGHDLLQKVKDSTPQFFEKLVIDLLVAMGYGGSRKDAGEAIGKVDDGGIDGIIREDKLGLDTIYIQAKKWKEPVGRPEIQKFVGALHGKHARKGIFITTSGFGDKATDYVETIDTKVILIGGEMLAKFMIEYNVGVSPEVSYDVKKIDSDYFES